MNITSARNVSEFVHVLARDSEGRPIQFLVPGHEGRQYKVTLKRNGGLRAECQQVGSIMHFTACKGNSHCVCYHVLAACIVSASEQGKELRWCLHKSDAERLNRIGGKVFTVKSAQSGKVAYGVVRDTGLSSYTCHIDTDDAVPDIILQIGPAGLNKADLVDLAVRMTSDKKQWYSGETVYIAEDAYLHNDDHYIRLYRRGDGKYPRPKRLATIWYLDIGNIEAGWQRTTEAQRAREELFSP